MSVIPITPRHEPEVRKALAVVRDTGRGQPPKRLRKPMIYFAGRMAGCKHCRDWRDAVTGFHGLYNHEGIYSDPDGSVDSREAVNCGAFWYGGPFVIDGTGGHNAGHTAFEDSHQIIWDIDRKQIARADLIFAYLEDAEAFGTLVELGYANALGKPIALGFSDTMKRDDYDELWLARMTAAKVYVGPPGAVWHQVCADWVRL